MEGPGSTADRLGSSQAIRIRFQALGSDARRLKGIDVIAIDRGVNITLSRSAETKPTADQLAVLKAILRSFRLT